MKMKTRKEKTLTDEKETKTSQRRTRKKNMNRIYYCYVVEY